MPTRPRTGSGRTKKTAPPVAKHPAADSTPPTRGSEAGDSTEVTAARLERREIPSFSIDREARIAEAAYWRAERRGFAPGQELDDWLAAEKEVDGNTGAAQAQRTGDG
ncbi:MAG TPA: DUF2934 domain-containing protein [Steroidobacteraceae bacterium]|nr:DUF2934 domain-containing protein [Steroidobacteraceae bacterium]